MQVEPISLPRRRTMRDAAAVWLALVAVYMIFAGSIGVNEGLAGAVCASGATAWWWVVGRRGGRFQFERAAIRPLGPALRNLPRQTARTGLHLVGAVFGRVGGGTTHARSAAALPWATPQGSTAPATRAVGLFAASLAPDSYVLTLDRAHGTVTTHALQDDDR